MYFMHPNHRDREVSQFSMVGTLAHFRAGGVTQMPPLKIISRGCATFGGGRISHLKPSFGREALQILKPTLRDHFRF